MSENKNKPELATSNTGLKIKNIESLFQKNQLFVMFQLMLNVEKRLVFLDKMVQVKQQHFT